MFFLKKKTVTFTLIPKQHFGKYAGLAYCSTMVSHMSKKSSHPEHEYNRQSQPLAFGDRNNCKS